MSEVDREKQSPQEKIEELQEVIRIQRLALTRIASHNPIKNVLKPGGLTIVRAYTQLQEIAEKALEKVVS